MCRKSTLFASIILVSKKCGSTNYENCNRIRQPDTAINNTHRWDYHCDCITRFANFGSTAKSKVRWRKNIAGLFTRQNSPDSKVSGFKAPTFNSGFKISGNMSKTGEFLFRIRSLVCKRQIQSGTKTFRIRHESGKISLSVNLVSDESNRFKW